MHAYSIFLLGNFYQIIFVCVIGISNNVIIQGVPKNWDLVTKMYIKIFKNKYILLHYKGIKN